MRVPKGNQRVWRLIATLALLLATTNIGACYYMQAIRGHFEIMNSRQPISEVIADEESPEVLRERLKIVQEARNFAVSELQLADNESYQFYADLGRDYVVWNVFAAPEFSLEPKTWCFPVAGCVAYRGYFAQEAAREKARSLSDDGYDVAVGGVSAYSTLGKFADPVLNTMMRWPDEQLVATIFHELAHQKLYIKGDTAFNESFATAVADIGIRRWFEQRHDSAGLERVEQNRSLRYSMMSLVEDTKNELRQLYESGLDDALKRARKQAILEELSAAILRLMEGRGADAADWLRQPLNNARLVSFGLYEGYQDAFRKILDDCNDDLTCFYAESRRLAKLDRKERQRHLEQTTE